MFMSRSNCNYKKFSPLRVVRFEIGGQLGRWFLIFFFVTKVKFHRISSIDSITLPRMDAWVGNKMDQCVPITHMGKKKSQPKQKFERKIRMIIALIEAFQLDSSIVLGFDCGYICETSVYSSNCGYFNYSSVHNG